MGRAGTDLRLNVAAPVGIAAAALAALLLDKGALTQSSPVPAAGEAFSCSPVMVWDGDGPVHCAEGPRVRLAGIAARELTPNVRSDGAADGGCRRGHPCPAADAVEARDALVALLGEQTGHGPHGHALVRGPVLRCVSAGSAGGKRVAAWCRSPVAGDLSCAMVAGGYAARWPRYWRGHQCR